MEERSSSFYGKMHERKFLFLSRVNSLTWVALSAICLNVFHSIPIRIIAINLVFITLGFYLADNRLVINDFVQIFNEK